MEGADNRKQAGFTLVELIIAMMVAAVVLSLAVPAFGDIALNARRTTVVNALVRDVHLARSETHKRARTVSVCASDGGRQCALTGQAWHLGWLVFVNLDRDEPPRVDPGEPVLFARPGFEQGRLTANRRAFHFRPFNKRSTAGTLVYCDRRGSPAARAVIVSATGRPRVSARDPARRPLPCP
jgi:type IV fimbrial biogenesis protein FimT